jgi:uncharacterized repeat protein (TIGR03943 family)
VRTKTQGLLVLVAGLVAIRLVVNGSFESYVKPSMRVPLITAGVVLVVLGFLTALRAAGEEEVGRVPAEPSSHDHSGPRIGWLLALPLITLLLVAPAPLGADAASRQQARSPDAPVGGPPPLPPPVNGAVDLSITEYLQRALWDSTNSIDDVPVRLTGFVVHDSHVPDGFLVARFVLTCCAADAYPVVAGVRGGGMPPEDTWVAVTGVLIPPPDEIDPSQPPPRVDIAATSVTEIPEPPSPYD